MATKTVSKSTPAPKTTAAKEPSWRITPDTSQKGASESYGSSYGSGSSTPGKSSSSVPAPKDNGQISNGKGYTYNDQYNFNHVVSDYGTAKQYSGNGNIYDYSGTFGGGYALNSQGERVAVGIPGAARYSNDIRDNTPTEWTSNGIGQLVTGTPKPQAQASPAYSPPPTYAAAGQPTAKVPPMKTESVSAPQTSVASAVSTSVPGTTTSNVPAPKQPEHPLDYYLSEIGRSQLAYGEYKGRADLQNLAHQNANNLKSQAKADGWDLSPYEGKGYTQFYNKQGSAGAYDPQQQGKVQRSVPAPGGPNQTTGNPVTDAQNGLVYKPNESPYAFRTEQQIQAQEHAKTENLIAQQKALANQKKAAYQLSYDRMNAQEADQRALENNQFERNNNPYSGGSDYRRAMLDRERAITDRGQNEDLMTKLSATDSELYNYIQNASVEEQDRILKQVESERNASLQWRSQDFAEQKGTFDTNYNIGKDKRDFDRGVLESNRTFTAQQDAAKAEAAQKALANEWASSEAIGKVTPKLSKLTGIPAGTPTIEARKMAAQQDQFNKTYQLDKDKAAFDKWSEKERIAITKAANQTEKEYKDYLKNQQISETTAKNRTKQAVADVMGTDTREEALDILKTTSGQLGQDGVDIREVLAAIDSRYPGGQSSTAEELKQIELELKKQEYQDTTGKPYQAPKQVGG